MSPWWKAPRWLRLRTSLPREEQQGYPAPPRNSLANVAVWRDEVPVVGIATNPDFIAHTLQRAGYQVEFISSVQLADPEQLTRQRFDVSCFLTALPFLLLLKRRFRPSLSRAAASSPPVVTLSITHC